MEESANPQPTRIPTTSERYTPLPRHGQLQARCWKTFVLSSCPEHAGWAFCTLCYRWLRSGRQHGTNGLNRHHDTHFSFKSAETSLAKKSKHSSREIFFATSSPREATTLAPAILIPSSALQPDFASIAVMGTTSRFKTAIVGFGLSGKVFHSCLISANPDFELTAIVSNRPDAVHQIYPSVVVLPSLHDLLANKNLGIDIVILCSPAHLHFEQASQVLQAGLHVVVEKPFAATSDQARELINLASSLGKVIVPFHNRRFDSDFSTVEKVLSSGILGNTVSFESRWDRFVDRPPGSSWKDLDLPAAGNIYSLGSHMIDQALALFGIPDSITASLRTQRPNAQVNDFFDIQFSYALNPELRVSLISSLVAKTCAPRFVIHGTLGSFVKYGLDPQEDQLKAGKLPKDYSGYGIEDSGTFGTAEFLMESSGLQFRGTIESSKGCYDQFYSNLASHLRGESVLRITPSDAFAVIRAIELSIQSWNEKRTVSWS